MNEMHEVLNNGDIENDEQQYNIVPLSEIKNMNEFRETLEYNYNINRQYDAKTLFEYACNINVEAVKYIIKYSNINIHENYEYCFRHACKKGTLEIVKYLIEYCEILNSKIDIHAYEEEGFLNACATGKLDIVKYLIEYGEKNNTKINIHICNDIVFRNLHFHTDVMTFLIRYCITNNEKINIHATNDRLFKIACLEKNIELLKFLMKYSSKIKSKYKMGIYKKCFDKACESKDLNTIKVIKYLLDNRQNMYNLESSFINLCIAGDLVSMKYLIEYVNKRKIRFDISKYKEEIFISLCSLSDIENIKYIIEYYESNNNKIIEASILEKGYNLLCSISVASKIYNTHGINYCDCNSCRRRAVYCQCYDCCSSVNMNTLEIIKYLLEYCSINKIKINVNNKEAWCNMYGTSNLEVMIYIIKYNINNNMQIDIKKLTDTFYIACSLGNLDVIKYIVEYNRKHNNTININIDRLFDCICCKNDTIKYIYEYCISIGIKIDLFSKDNYLFQSACYYNNMTIIKYLIDHSESEYKVIRVEYNDILSVIYGFNSFESIKIILNYCNKHNIQIEDDTFKYILFVTCGYMYDNLLNCIIDYYERRNIKIVFNKEDEHSIISLSNKCDKFTKYIIYLQQHNYSIVNIKSKKKKELTAFYKELLNKKYDSICTMRNKLISNNNIMYRYIFNVYYTLYFV